MTLEPAHLSILLALAALVWNVFNALRLNASELRRQLSDCEKRLIVLETKTAPLWSDRERLLERRLAEMLHQPHRQYRRMDLLLDELKVNPDGLSDAELQELNQLLYQRKEDTRPGGPDENLAHHLAANLLMQLLDDRLAAREMRRLLVQRTAEAVEEIERQTARREPWWSWLSQLRNWWYRSP